MFPAGLDRNPHKTTVDLPNTAWHKQDHSSGKSNESIFKYMTKILGMWWLWCIDKLPQEMKG